MYRICRGPSKHSRRAGDQASAPRGPAPPTCLAHCTWERVRRPLLVVQLKIYGRTHWLWRAVDQDGVMLDALVELRRNQEAAEAFLRRLVEGHRYQRRVVFTDNIPGNPPAVSHILSRTEHRRHKSVNNRAERAHRPTRRREYVQQFLGLFSPISDPLATTAPKGRGASVSGTRSRRFRLLPEHARFRPSCSQLPVALTH
jgi:hypothetical protein